MNNIILKRDGDYYVFYIETTSEKNMLVKVFDAPSGNIYSNTIGHTKGNDTFEFRMNSETFNKVGEITIIYFISDDNNAFISFWPSIY